MPSLPVHTAQQSMSVMETTGRAVIVRTYDTEY